MPRFYQKSEDQIILEEIKAADGVVVSLAEHNLNFTTAFKNVLDWVSRIDMQFLLGKKLLVLSTSPGGFGGGNVMEIGLKYFGFAGGEVVAGFDGGQTTSLTANRFKTTAKEVSAAFREVNGIPQYMAVPHG